jgi:predicted DNA-binding protein with PD1-like motif
MGDNPGITAVECHSGRCFLGNVAHGEDLVAAIEGFCVTQGVKTAVFSMIGALTTATLGAYDQKQQVYVTFTREGPLEIVHCGGNISLKNGVPTVHAHAVLADINGSTLGGHIFSESRVFAGEILVRELVGTPCNRRYDHTTGLYLWKDR